MTVGPNKQGRIQHDSGPLRFPRMQEAERGPRPTGLLGAIPRSKLDGLSRHHPKHSITGPQGLQKDH